MHCEGIRNSLVRFARVLILVLAVPVMQARSLITLRIFMAVSRRSSFGKLVLLLIGRWESESIRFHLRTFARKGHLFARLNVFVICARILGAFLCGLKLLVPG